MQRVVDLASGHTMVVSDLHGDQDAFARYTGRFLQLRSRGRAQRLLLLGDLIHSNEPEDADSSLQIVTDIMRLQATLGADACIALLGNHEMEHIYSLLLARGSFEYTPRFERVLSASGKRAEILNFFQAMPFYVRTAAGVSFTHAGPDGRAMAGSRRSRRSIIRRFWMNIRGGLTRWTQTSAPPIATNTPVPHAKGWIMQCWPPRASPSADPTIRATTTCCAASCSPTAAWNSRRSTTRYLCARR